MSSQKGLLHEDLTRKDEAPGPSDRKFAFQVGGVFVGASILLLSVYRYRHGSWTSESGWGPWPIWTLGIGVLLLILGSTVPAILGPVNKAWMKLGLVLYVIVNPIVMFLLFALVMTPMGFLVRLFGKDLLRMKLDRAAASYWILREPPGPSPESMKNQF